MHGKQPGRGSIDEIGRVTAVDSIVSDLDGHTEVSCNAEHIRRQLDFL
jgi:hypothetical protein